MKVEFVSLVEFGCSWNGKDLKGQIVHLEGQLFLDKTD